ncbi:fructose-6-phosphate aldolase [Clostridium perfringens]|uniref:Probable transaldolase n=1 Tax=Clostridium perfringens (strain SM101 / Type A) TaxID=289380 RepID=TAL_CLOPS|nr:fructose-6-phosphate aldolase [Clostridium perfringens]Q0SV41.1 RecName: Full=Probable transaldolase [Clostridium perfringens SM101]ABG86705.1 putative transaldolase [Clostridium perfringens SM101]EJT5918047.1 fructose-6-phosphate aldolase [Clostridium perfringens]EJT5926337.1 fructose-6-phosphate aldolase [Clostridium perfringens]EJT5940255.1 fructose-6-phosphate aldolase [Clostridium perfringens]EJT6136749.1 fructose-6-phosphate aldolase [Clostridium perfringens]
MKIFIDTANVEEIRKASKLGVLAGVTTNPSLIAKEGRDIKEVIEEICSIVDGPISAEVMALECDEMVREGIELAKIHKNIVIKIPMCEEGLKAVKVLASEGIRTNVTLIFSPLQALLAARAGASFVSPFLGRLDDIGNPGIEIVTQIAEMFALHGIDTEIISASVRNPMHVLDSAMAGSHIATIPYNVILQMVKHPLTDAGMKKFIEDYNKAFNK